MTKTTRPTNNIGENVKKKFYSAIKTDSFCLFLIIFWTAFAKCDPMNKVWHVFYIFLLLCSCISFLFVWIPYNMFQVFTISTDNLIFQRDIKLDNCTAKYWFMFKYGWHGNKRNMLRTWSFYCTQCHIQMLKQFGGATCARGKKNNKKRNKCMW